MSRGLHSDLVTELATKNINAVDTRGFRSLLNNERGTIVNIINTAVTDKGRAKMI